MFESIITLSLNPAIDVTLWTDRLNPAGDNMVKEERYDAAGKAVNVSRALGSYGTESLALVLVGNHNRDRYESRLIAEKIRYKILEVEGYTRENISVVQPDRTVTRLIREGFTVDQETVEAILLELESLVDEKTLVVISGRLPNGVSPRQLKNICGRITELGGKIALDTASVTAADILEIKPWVIKPNRAEISGYAGHPLETEDEMIAFAQKLTDGGVEHCLVSLDSDGLLYVGREEQHRVHVPDINVVCAVGAGDCCLAGFIIGINSGHGLTKCLKGAAAFGTAACLTEGPNPPTKIAMANIVQQVSCR